MFRGFLRDLSRPGAPLWQIWTRPRPGSPQEPHQHHSDDPRITFPTSIPRGRGSGTEGAGVWDAGGMTDQRRLVDDIDTWAPAGWTPSDVGWQDDEPFGSVLGDPLMGSPLFDVSAFDADRDRKSVV